jgi:ABC-type multidrug transport system fused ATPase/permease subunit
MQLVEFYASYSSQHGALDAMTFGVNLVFPIGNVVRALLVGLNVNAISCQDGAYISYGGSLYAYGGPILYLCIQIGFFIFLLLWIERGHFSTRAGRRHHKEDPECISWPTSLEVENERNRAVVSESDLVRVLGVTKRFGSTIAVDNVTLGVRNGEILVILGPNGAGKSTLFDLIRCQLRPNDGTIVVQGYDTVTQRHQVEQYIGGKNTPSHKVWGNLNSGSLF